MDGSVQEELLCEKNVKVEGEVEDSRDTKQIKLRHDASISSPTSFGLGSGTISGHFLRYLRWTKRQWGRHWRTSVFSWL